MWVVKLVAGTGHGCCLGMVLLSSRSLLALRCVYVWEVGVRQRAIRIMVLRLVWSCLFDRSAIVSARTRVAIVRLHCVDVLWGKSDCSCYKFVMSRCQDVEL